MVGLSRVIGFVRLQPEGDGHATHPQEPPARLVCLSHAADLLADACERDADISRAKAGDCYKTREGGYTIVGCVLLAAFPFGARAVVVKVEEATSR